MRRRDCLVPDFSLEDDCTGPVAGIDEAGRGPWAGPVVAAAVVLDRLRVGEALLARIDDSKKLSKPVREELLEALRPVAAIGVGFATPAEIDEINILQATMRAMRRAADALPDAPAMVLVDGNRLPDLDCPGRAIVKGDGLSYSIAAASIVAKVTRDQHMAELARRHPGYGWERNAGYGTAEHKAALARLGITSAHRRSFKPIARYCE
jgi:ribonuclease HII